MTAFYVGDGLNALLPAFIGLAQGVGVRSECLNDSRPHLTPAAIAPDAAPRFGIGTFFVCLAVLCCASTAAFALLNNLSVCRRQLLARESPEVTPEITLLHADSDSGRVEVVTAVYVDRGTLSGADDLWEVAALLAIALWVNGLTNGLLNSSQPYASMPYGVETYAWALRLSYIAKPALCFFVLYQRALCSLAAVAFWTLVGSAVAAYQIYLAVKSPHPPLQDQIGGKILVVSTTMHDIRGEHFVFVNVSRRNECRSAIISKSLLSTGSVLHWSGSRFYLRETRRFLSPAAEAELSKSALMVRSCETDGQLPRSDLLRHRH